MNFDTLKVITITHPFHPDNGKSYEYIERIHSKLGERVMCSDEAGKLRIFPISITNLLISSISECAEKHNCVTLVDDLFLLKNLIDSLSESKEV